MARVVKLIKVEGGANNNKYYNMFEEGGQFRAEYGRVGANPQVRTYPMHRWESTYKSKLGKGYKDVTELFVEGVSDSVDFKSITDSQIDDLMRKLQGYASRKVAANYSVSAESVTKAQIAEAQSIIDAIAEILAAEGEYASNVSYVNAKLSYLYSVIPRKMKNVRDHLLNDFDKARLAKMIEAEQDLLDTMSTQVSQTKLTKENKDDQKTILEAMGLDIVNASPAEQHMLKKMLGQVGDRFLNAFKVTHKSSDHDFKKYVGNNVVNTETTLLFHGSRNENWLSILETGLVLRPSNAVITGKMFGYGIYFADKAMKSLGYTSSRGSRWAGGSSNEAFLAVFEVHTGSRFKIQRHQHWCSSLNYQKLREKGSFDSLHAIGGVDLRNDEFIVYNQEQATIRYLIHLRG